ncbi:6811_t:CDS:2 [Acaulospora morrowiae]|uniref:6811_t:CDS:1 n=1 Tax=Acaulospora morrowiae TaxID=94023 RepID=A0A9N9B481_9GLOM|nr:6811_t:CDS:2 [Acaulospora morrowiae]
MPRKNKLKKHLIEASRKCWKKIEEPYETSDAEPDQPVKLYFDFTLEEDDNDSDDNFIVEL